MQFELVHCCVRFQPFGVETEFKDGAVSINRPSPTADFLAVASQCGFTDALSYVQHHDLSHNFLAEKMHNAPSPILWSAAHGSVVDRTMSLYEERWVYHWQRFVMNAAGPMEREWIDWRFHWEYLFRQ